MLVNVVQLSSQYFSFEYTLQLVYSFIFAGISPERNLFLSRGPLEISPGSCFVLNYARWDQPRVMLRSNSCSLGSAPSTIWSSLGCPLEISPGHGSCVVVMLTAQAIAVREGMSSPQAPNYLHMYLFFGVYKYMFIFVLCMIVFRFAVFVYLAILDVWV